MGQNFSGAQIWLMKSLVCSGLYDNILIKLIQTTEKRISGIILETNFVSNAFHGFHLMKAYQFWVIIHQPFSRSFFVFCPLFCKFGCNKILIC